MGSTQQDITFLATYYRDTGFVNWISSNNFIGITAQNVAKYYSLFQRSVMCQNKFCYECSGFVPVWSNEYEIANACFKQEKCVVKVKQEQQAAADDFANKFNPPPVFASINLEALTKLSPLVIPTIKSYVLNYGPKLKNGLYIYSAEHGVGRSSLLWWVLTELVKQRKIYNGYVAETSGMFAEKLVCDVTEAGHPYFKLAVSCDILILDDVGSENYTPGYTERLLTILEDRYRNLKPVVVSSVRPMELWAWKENREPELFSKFSKMCAYMQADQADVESEIV